MIKKLNGGFHTQQGKDSANRRGKTEQATGVSPRKTESDLMSLFPFIDKASLHEVFLATNGDACAAVEAIQASLNTSSQLINENCKRRFCKLDSQHNLSDAMEEKARNKSSNCLRASAPRNTEKDVETSAEKSPLIETDSKASDKFYHVKSVENSYDIGSGDISLDKKEKSHPSSRMRSTSPERIAEHRNGSRNDFLSVDLHGLNCNEAVQTLSAFVDGAKKRNVKCLDVVTGRGSHSKGNLPKLRPSVISYLNQEQYRFTVLNEGCIRVFLR